MATLMREVTAIIHIEAIVLLIITPTSAVIVFIGQSSALVGQRERQRIALMGHTVSANMPVAPVRIMVA